MADRCASLASQARARFSSRQNLEVETVAPVRAAVSSTLRNRPTRSMKITDTIEGRKCNSRRRSPLPSARCCRSVTEVAPHEAAQWPSDLLPLPTQTLGGELLAEGLPFKFETLDVGEMSPNAITDAALHKSQLLLDHLLSLDISDERPRVSGPAGAAVVEMGQDTENAVDAEKPSTGARPTQPADPATVQVPAKFMQMLGEMWEQVKGDQERADRAPTMPSTHADFWKSYHDPDQVSVGSTHLPSSSNLSSPNCSTPATSPGSSARSIGSPIEYCSLSPIDKAQLIQDLKKDLSASSPHMAPTLSPMLSPCAQNPSGLSIPAAISPRQIPASAALQPSRYLSLAPAQFGSAVPTGHFVWQAIAVTTIHRVLASR